MLSAGCVLFLLVLPATPARAQTDCLACHGDVTMTDAAGHNVGVDATKFHAGIHGSLHCTDCHSDIKGYPHPAQPSKVDCGTCHTAEAADLVGSVHQHAGAQPCLSCHGNPHYILPKSSPQSSVYPLNVPATCGKCHGNAQFAKQHHLTNVYPEYIDSIHGFAVSKEGLLVAANCASCHGSHHILSPTDPQSPTYRANIPQTCGKCHAGILTRYMAGIHGQQLKAGNPNAPVCTDCHTAHGIAAPNSALSTDACGRCHQAQLTTYRDTFHSKVSHLGAYVEVARCSDCHGEHNILPPSDPLSTVNPRNLIKTCGKCHQGANAGFVQYQPHANDRSWRQSPVLFSIHLFMVILLSSVLTFFLIHSLLWLIRSLIDRA
ncbi:MAG: cytochrome c3 family protein [Acidobacteriaceae bacterium]